MIYTEISVNSLAAYHEVLANNQMASIITVVGTSASGKTSVAPLIQEQLSGMDYEVRSIIEPGPLRPEIKWYRQNMPQAHRSQAILFAADRTITYDKDILPYMDEDNLIFFSTRGFPDTRVYQSILGSISKKEIYELNKHIPFSNLYIALVVDGVVGEQRALQRERETGEPVTHSEKKETIDTYKRAYESLQTELPNFHVINTSYLSLDEVVQKSMEVIKNHVL